MRRTANQVLTAAGLIALGWAAGSSQTSQPDFEIVVRNPPAVKQPLNVGAAALWLG